MWPSEKEIVLSNSPWEFNQDVSVIFDNHIRRSVPFYEELHRMVVELSDEYITDGSTICDLGTATGELLLRMSDKYENYKLNLIGIDNSSAMLSKAHDKCKSIYGISFIDGDITTCEIPKSQLLISIYTLQFVSKYARVDVIRNVFESLHKGGAFILAEKISSEIDKIDQFYIKAHEDLKRRNGISDDEIAAKRESLRSTMFTNTLINYIDMIKSVGFVNVDVFFKWYNFAGIIAVKE